ncbi:alpha/beta hydrolase [Novosphingobium sp. 1949]|uniref:Palmitoyl-protein thioesterase ABHD10, mitochondrial n=1 Tax=Novosphingobium organovorum TaxID=2930092 RepID=A0ABT0BHY5_9SPHN|nr:alpha/beta hydrolase [Novosphingobium organovorum]MCJ2184639.1 alpha/beta hydrolase [Novosphingobium organovorum]
MTEIRFHEMPDGRRIAHRFTPGQGPTLVFLPGYMSDMAGSKATALFDMAVHAGRACLLLDYSGCGQSSGDFADGTLSRWRDEVVALIAAAALDKVVLIGSSMGGWLMLMVAEALPDTVHSMIGIAAAPDFTDWGVAQMDKGLLADGETIYEDNPYGPEPTPTHPGFWADGQANLQLESPIGFDGPVRLLQGQRDAEVPWELALRLSETLRSDDVQVTFIKDGDHRLSRESDLAVLMRTVAELVLARETAA